jgi:hypothetical protein
MVEKNKGTQTIIIAVLAVAVLAMSVGFAVSAYTQNLNINDSTVNVTAAKWNVHFDDTSYTETTGSVAATSHTLTGTTMVYAVTLAKPGDFYEFTVNVKNEGTFDANLTSLTMSSLTTEQSKYLTYTITYNNGTTYSASNATITGVTLPKTTGVAPVKVRVTYVAPADSANLPTTDQTVTLSATLTYTQVQ